jgi:hypothetical protein
MSDYVSEQNAVSEPPVPPQPRLVDVEVTSEIVALNLMVSFLNLAQRRGIYSIDESAKIWECIKKFQKASGTASE